MTAPRSTPPPTRRQALALAGGALASFPLAACGSGAPDDQGGSGGDFTLYWNPGHDYDAYQAVVDAFGKEHGLTVRMQKYQWPDMRTRILTDFSSGNVPDLIEGAGWTQEFALSGDALSLRKYVDRDGDRMGFPADWQQAAVQHNAHKGEPYGIQLHQTCSLLLYNRKMFREAGVRPPTTWDEVVEVCTALTGDGVHGIALNQDQSYAWPWMLQNGVREYDPETGELLTPRDAAIEALQFQADLVHEHKVSPVPTPGTDYSGPQKLLSAGRVAMIVSGPWDLDPIAQTSPDLDLGIAQMPRKRKQATILAGTSLFIPAKAKRPDLSWDLIKRFTTLKTELAVTEEAGMLMPRKSWGEKPLVQDDPHTRAFAEGLAYAEDPHRGLYLTGHYGEISEDLWKRLYQSVVMEKQPVAQAYEEYRKAGRRILEG
ncbi:ABC transporter substrate-binding protein [Streptomyces sp. JJ36]|uniref:ABC transporter substrate-binding protein n=1 Tax=Streptomyces sp. JJ36 TaxID=2736645 RepID=UPI001F1D53A1|nr:extracellular solute-binding protein [Streptomyces sp. JJ36]MCF6525253.1 extracellular solute-binding protein [Streptomyces sp. JJ36]